MSWKNFKLSTGFTLIELLIVVAIIGILAAIAIPNFLQAQVRAKVSRVQSDIRNYIQGTEMYIVDNNMIPLNPDPAKAPTYKFHRSPYWQWYGPPWILSTPIDYLSNALLIDPFVNVSGPLPPHTVGNILISYNNPLDPYWTNRFRNFNGASAGQVDNPLSYAYWSLGPDKLNGYLSGETSTYYGQLYDPTNGTISRGDIGNYYVGGSPVRPVQ